MKSFSVCSLLAVVAGILASGLLACEPKSVPPQALAAAGSPPPPAAQPVPPAPTRKSMPRAADWKRVEALVAEDKFEEARAVCQTIRSAAQQAGNNAEWSEALLKETQLQIGLHGYETAVRFLRSQPWPTDLLSQVALELYYASSLGDYFNAYSWEINQRERVDGKGELDLKAWTKDQIYNQAQAAYARLWAQRLELSQAQVGQLGELLKAGSYPATVRSGLRDELSYFAVELLTNTQFWRPEESSELYRLDFPALLRGTSPPAAIGLDDTKVHPLGRAMAVLDDLESYHQQQGHKEAALEARLQRLRRLHQSFTDSSERAAIRADLEQRLPAYRQLPWWATGMATLAELVRDGEHDLVRAHQIASAGAAAYPDSPGGKSCRFLAQSIEAADYSLEAMLSDGPGQRSLRVQHKNVGRLYFRAYALDLLARIESAQDYNLLLGQSEVADLLRRSKPLAEWQTDLPATPDYRTHQTYVTPPLKQVGLYAVVASLRPDFAQRDNRVHGANLILTDLILVTRQHDTQLETTVVSAATGQPVAGATVLLYQQNYNRHHQRIASEHTDAQGVVRLRQKDGQSCYVVAQNGRDATVDLNTFYLYRGYDPPKQQQALVYTDRSVYRPQQKVLFKLVAYRGKPDSGQLEVAPKVKLSAVLLDPNSQEVASAPVVTNDFGTAAGELTIPSGRLLGSWRIEVRGGYGGSAGLQVEEYKRPTFELSFKDPEQPLRLNRPATLVGEAHYFFGLPVTAGQVRYRVSREPVLPWWWYLWGWGQSSGSSQTVHSGLTPLRPDGTFAIAFTPTADERRGEDPDITYRYLLKADLTDDGGETRSAERAFRLGFVAVEATIDIEQGFASPAGGGSLHIRRASLDGVPRPGDGHYRLLALKPPAHALLPADEPLPPPPDDAATKSGPSFHTAGDTLKPRWQSGYSATATLSRLSDGSEKHQGPLHHDPQGLATLKLPPLPAGPYRLRYDTVDEFGSKATAWQDFIVAGAGDAAVASQALPLLLLAERSQVAVGEKLRLLVGSGLADQPVVIERFRSGRLVERRLQRSGELIELAVGDEDRGGIGLLAWVARDHQYLAQSLSIAVPWDNKQLKLEFATFRDKLRPGTHETWRVTVKTSSGQALAKGMAELLAYMYDRSLDLFAPHQPQSPQSLWPFRGGAVDSRSSLGLGSTVWVYNQLPQLVPPPALRGASLKSYDGYPIGGIGNLGTIGRGGGGRLGFATRATMLPGAPPPPPPPPEAAANTKARPDEKPAQPPVDKALAEKRSEAASGTPAPTDAGSGLRSNFAETAFFLPSLLTDSEGSAVLEFVVPDSVTSWNVWVHAITRDLRAGSIKKESRSLKDLLVRPYLPRFFRESDSADLKVMVSNASDRRQVGSLRLSISDPATGTDQLKLFQVANPERPFTVEPGKSVTLTFPLSAPRQVGTYAFQVTAKAGDLSDGELRPLPVLPSRLHLSESRFVSLHDRDKKTLRFADLAKNDDPTRLQEQLVVTLDAQLFYTVLKALPYLVSYPYECVEQTLNRFLSTGIVSSLYGQYPAVAKLAKDFSSRKTQLEGFAPADPNRKMTLEESPWLDQAQGQRSESGPLINVLDPQIARAQRDSALAKLQKAQTALGGFPWFPGGPPSPFMTLYLLNGFAKASEFQVELPQQMVSRSWQYLSRHFRDAYVGCLAGSASKDPCDWEFLTLLNYVATAFPDPSWTAGGLTSDEQQAILRYSFAHWQQHSPYLKALLALTLKRLGRLQDGRLVFASVMDSAKSSPDQGTFWAAEDRSWLWYNDTIESHAFALRALLELDPQNSKRDGLVLWLLINKKLNQWKSTRATAEVIYSLVHYLKLTGALGVREEATVSIGPSGQLGQKQFVFAPDKYVGQTQLVVPGPRLAADPVAAAQITVEKSTPGYLFASATWHYSTDRLPSQGHGDFFQVDRTYFKRENNGKDFVLRPLSTGEALKPGDEVEVQLSLRSQHAAEYVHLRDPRAAGLEPISTVSSYKWDLGLVYYQEVRDSGMNFFFEQLPVGQYTFKYRLRCSLAGTFRVGPATVQSMYAPEFSAFSAGHSLKIDSTP